MLFWFRNTSKRKQFPRARLERFFFQQRAYESSKPSKDSVAVAHHFNNGSCGLILRVLGLAGKDFPICEIVLVAACFNFWDGKKFVVSIQVLQLLHKVSIFSCQTQKGHFCKSCCYLTKSRTFFIQNEKPYRPLKRFPPNN